jgi:hypothetical protein
VSELEISRFLVQYGSNREIEKKLIIIEKAPRGYMGTFSILFRIVQLLHLTIFSFLLFFSNIGLKMS